MTNALLENRLRALESSAVQLIDRQAKTLDDMRCDYRAKHDTRFAPHPKGIYRQGSGADYHVRNEVDYYLLMELNRNLDQDNDYVGQGIDRFCTNVIQHGYGLKPQTGDDRIDDILKDLWLQETDDENTNLDVRGEANFHQWEYQTLRNPIVDGDIAVNGLRSGQIEGYEGHRVRTPFDMVGRRQRLTSQRDRGRPRNDTNRVFLGVEKDSNSKPLAFWVTREDYNGLPFSVPSTSQNMRRVTIRALDTLTGRQERNLFFIAHRKRMLSETRGMGKLTPNLVTAGMLNDVNFAQLVKQQAASLVATIHKIHPAIEEYWGPAKEEGTAELDPSGTSPGNYNYEYYAMLGQDHWPRYRGEEMEMFSPNIPGEGYFDQARLLLTFVAVNLDMPLILFLLDANETNLSAWRGATNQAQLSFRRFQRWHSSQFHTPFYHWRVRRWLRTVSDLRRAFEGGMGLRIFSHEWFYPSWPYIDPLKDTQADLLAVEGVLTSPRRIHALRNQDYPVVIGEYCNDMGALWQCAKEEARARNEDLTPEEVEEGWRITPREVINLTSQGRQMQLVDPRSQQGQLQQQQDEDRETRETNERRSSTV